ncbi:MucB/RseB C-terminal domain-containing protein [Noviherbaspirillum galbum]|uniref:Transcriptional regulator n=1 Tax=Noviherbaspirillum galbum TaxID=2709383 RepID=A0A6B3SPT6_9BURK|nr:MucB/RseB C-terminal domain-containing protein [Noviherbaspirillum galbum]NEX62763.1 transcriptional regulator [Noviherbaspirillum galbum]
MGRTHLLLRFVVGISVALAVSAFAQTGEVPAEKRDAQQWLKKIQSAAQKLNYSGTFVYQQGNQIRTSRITHVVDGRNELEKLEILDGKPREYVRNNDEVVCYMPESRTLQVEKKATQDLFPAILNGDAGDLLRHYQVSKGESGRVAGHDCQAIVLEPKDNLRYGYKLWADKATGLLLRSQTLNDRMEVIEQIAFTQVGIGNVDRSNVRPSVTNTAGWRTEPANLALAAPSGWNVKDLPPGFHKVREVKRMVADGAANDGHGGQREVNQIVFSDGLAAISVFAEPGAQSRTEGTMQQGAMNILGKRHGDFWLTIVGEVPFSAIRQIANSIEFKSR